MKGGASAWRFLAASSLAGLLNGCMPLPYVIPALGYTADSRHNLSEQVPSFIVQGQTTRGEVLHRLGEPDTWYTDDPTFTYLSANRHGGVGTLIVPYAGNQFPDANTQRILFRRLNIRFDSAGLVSSAVNESKSCWIGSVKGDMLDAGVSVRAAYKCLNAPAAQVLR